VSGKKVQLIVVKAKFTCVGVRVNDLEKSVDFYKRTLSMRVTGTSKTDQARGETVTLESNGFALELNYYRKESPYHTEYVVGEGLDHLAFNVDDLTKALEEARTTSYRIISEMKSNDNR
jgi:catechol 2,3-dioxygenase-like lactoylglutathione lyase family enzyme